MNRRSKNNLSFLAGLAVSLLIIVAVHLLGPIDYYQGGLIMIASGIIGLIAQFFVSKDRPRSDLKWSGKEQKNALIIVGLGLILLGLAIVVVSMYVSGNGG